MIKNNSVIEDALFQIKNLEESLNKNAQGILSSTMKREIGSLVKESLLEQDEVEDEDDVDVDVSTMDDLEDIDADTDNLDDVDDDDDFSLDVDDTEDDMMDLPTMDSDEDTIDLTKASDAEVLRVFKAMGDEDGVIVKKENNMLHLSDNENDTEYLIQLGESDMPMRGSMRGSMMDDMPMRGSMKGSRFDDEDRFGSMKGGRFDDEDDYEDPFGDEFGDEFGDDDYDRDGFDKYSSNNLSFDEFGDENDDDFSFGEFKEIEDLTQQSLENDKKEMGEETIYELELDDDGLSGDRHPIEFMEMDDYDMSDNEDRYMGDELYSDNMPTDEFLEGWMNEAKMKAKAKGMGMGNASKFKYDKKPNQSGGFKTTMKQGTRGVGMGKAKFEYKEEVNDEGFGMKPKARGEFKEASRTLGNGKRWGREGLDKPKAAPRHLRKESTEELDLLRAKNGEYRKALDLFRTKLNEVAVFNSNLAYATRLFTEHSTTKQEKINILRRFDNAETLKESKNLYKYIKGELSEVTSKGDGTITESVQRTISRVPTTGSAVNLIESKTYENPQFLRIKDLMGKLK